MKVEYNDITKMKAALRLAQDQRFREALYIFVQVESYESYLNRIFCLCMTDDVAYAVDVYRAAKRKYGLTHALFADTLAFGELVSTVVNFCEPDRKYARAHDGKIRANKTFVIKRPRHRDDDEFFAPDLNFTEDVPLMENPRYASNNFYDVKSVEYFDSLRINMERCYMMGDQEGVKKYEQRLLDVETDHIPTLEAQISVVLYDEDYEKGLVYAQRLAMAEGGTNAAIGGAIEIVMRLDPEANLGVLTRLMQKALKIINDVTLYDLEDYVYIATMFVYDLEMAYKFALALYAEHQNANLEALKVCACAFFNYGNTALAKDAALELLRAAPDDVYAMTLAEVIRRTPYSKNMSPMELAPRVLRHFTMPAKLPLHANRELCGILNVAASTLTIGKKEMAYMAVLMLDCKSLIFTNQRRQYNDLMSFLRAIIRTAQPEDMEEFVDFAKSQLFNLVCDQSLEECLIARLIELGYKGQAVVSIGTQQGYGVLDFSKLEPLDPLFLDAFGMCATLARIDDTDKFAEAYRKIRSRTEISEREQYVTHKVAYAMLCMCLPRFERQEAADFFEPSEKAFFQKHVSLLSQ